jgi:Tfp pilus assembly protein PilO
MLTNREKKLGYLLIVVVVLCAAGLFFYFQFSELQRIEDKIEKTTRNIRKILKDTPDEAVLLEAIKELEQKIALEKSKFYAPGEIDLSAYYDVVVDVIQKNNLTIKKAQPESKPKMKYVDFQLTGNAYDLASFLEAVSTYKKYWSILEINVENRKQRNVRNGKLMNISMRIIYETDTTDNN